MKKKSEFLIDTDVLLDHLYHIGPSPSALEILMTKGICFTTVINASELLYSISNKPVVIDLLNALKVLGIHPKYSLNVDKYRNVTADMNEALFCAAAEMNKLPIVCLNKEKYISTGLKIILPQELTE